VINVRRLAAVDLAFLGPKIILPEFALGVVGLWRWGPTRETNFLCNLGYGDPSALHPRPPAFTVQRGVFVPVACAA
jgi:hypothetical protein